MLFPFFKGVVFTMGNDLLTYPKVFMFSKMFFSYFIKRFLAISISNCEGDVELFMSLALRKK